MKAVFKKIPGKLYSGLLIGCMDLIRRADALFAKIMKRDHKSLEWSETEKTASGFIEDQSLFAHIPFGKTNLAYAGCGVIAVYNCLHALGKDAALTELIPAFEQNGALHRGKLGISPVAIRQYLQKKNCIVKKTKDPDACDAAGIICTVMNDRDDITKQLHIFYAEKTERGYFPHNMRLSHLFYKSADDMIKAIGDGNAKLLHTIAVDKEVKNG